MCLGCPCPPSGVKGFIETFDFSGALVRTTQMPGISATAGSCCHALRCGGPQGNLSWRDSTCQHVLKYSPTGALPTTGRPRVEQLPIHARALWSDGPNLYRPAGVRAYGMPTRRRELDGSKLLAQFAADSAPLRPGRPDAVWPDRRPPRRRMVYNSAPAVRRDRPSAPSFNIPRQPSSWQYASDRGRPGYLLGVPRHFAVGLAHRNAPTQNLETAPLALKPLLLAGDGADQYEGVRSRRSRRVVASG